MSRGDTHALHLTRHLRRAAQGNQHDAVKRGRNVRKDIRIQVYVIHDLDYEDMAKGVFVFRLASTNYALLTFSKAMAMFHKAFVSPRLMPSASCVRGQSQLTPV